jgi:hypothetical protein
MKLYTKSIVAFSWVPLLRYVFVVSIVLVILFGSVLCTTARAGGMMGPVGATVNISTTLPSTDIDCTLSSPTPSLITASTCGVVGGNVEASFVVGNVPAGAYLIQVTGDSGDYVTLSFMVTG